MESQRGPPIIIIILHMYATQIIIMLRILIIIDRGPVRLNVSILLLLLLLFYARHIIIISFQR